MYKIINWFFFLFLNNYIEYINININTLIIVVLIKYKVNSCNTIGILNLVIKVKLYKQTYHFIICVNWVAIVEVKATAREAPSDLTLN